MQAGSSYGTLDESVRSLYAIMKFGKDTLLCSSMHRYCDKEGDAIEYSAMVLF